MGVLTADVGKLVFPLCIRMIFPSASTYMRDPRQAKPRRTSATRHRAGPCTVVILLGQLEPGLLRFSHLDLWLYTSYHVQAGHAV